MGSTSQLETITSSNVFIRQTTWSSIGSFNNTKIQLSKFCRVTGSGSRQITII